MPRILKNTGIFLKWLLLTPLLLIKLYLWVLFIAPFKVMSTVEDGPLSWEKFDSYMRNNPLDVLTVVVFGLGTAIFCWYCLVIFPYLMITRWNVL